MIEKAIEIKTPDGVADGFLYQPEGKRAHAGVIHLTDIMGIRPSHQQMAGRLADQGYVVLMPNMFYRTGKPPLFDFQPQLGEERTMKRFGELRGPLTPEAVERDVGAYVDFLGASPDVTGKIGVVGYCFAGSVAMRTAAAKPDRVAAAASFHGGHLFTKEPTSPHLLLPRIKARLLFGHAVQDQSMPEEAINGFNEALAAWGGRYESQTYEGARHGWTVPGMPVYNEKQAERAFGKLTELFAQTLGS
jgi:carboxymethylenebutenolidase